MSVRDRLRRLERRVGGRPGEPAAVVYLPYNGRDPPPGRYGPIVIYAIGGPDDPDREPDAPTPPGDDRAADRTDGSGPTADRE